MSAQKPASWAYSEDFVTETEVIEAARLRGEELGCMPVMAGVGATLRLLAATVSARAVVEIGTGAGVSGLWLLAGMPSDGILTTIDVEAEHQRSARQAYAAAGVAPQRTRVITGRALDVVVEVGVGVVLFRADLTAGQPGGRIIGEGVEPDPLLAAHPVKEDVGGDPVQPALEGAGLVGVQRAEHADEHVVGQVLGVVHVAGQAIGQAVDPGRVLRDDLFPGRRHPGLPCGICRVEWMLRYGAVTRGGGHVIFLRMGSNTLIP